MLSKLSDVIHSITPYISDATSGVLNKIGITSLAATVSNAVVTKAIESQNETWLTISNSVAVVSIIGSIMFIVKLAYAVYFDRLRNKREAASKKLEAKYAALKNQREEEAHQKLMSRDTPKN